MNTPTISNTSALAVTSTQEFWSANQLAALRQIGVENAPQADLAVFLNYSQRTGLDPFARQIYMIGRKQRQGDNWTTKWTIQASIDGLRIVAERSGDYAGQVGPEYCGADGVWRDVWIGNEPPVASRVGVLRKGFAAPLYAVAYWHEYVQTDRDGNPTSMWRSKPLLMLAKCAEALALRKAFPNDLAGLYTADEMGAADNHAPAMRPMAAPAPVQPIEDAVIVNEATGEIVESNDAPPASEPQLKAIAAILKKCGITERVDRHNVATLILGRPIGDGHQLTKADAHTIIDTIKPLADSDDPTAAFTEWHGKQVA